MRFEPCCPATLRRGLGRLVDEVFRVGLPGRDACEQSNMLDTEARRRAYVAEIREAVKAATSLTDSDRKALLGLGFLEFPAEGVG